MNATVIFPARHHVLQLPDKAGKTMRGICIRFESQYQHTVVQPWLHNCDHTVAVDFEAIPITIQSGIL